MRVACGLRGRGLDGDSMYEMMQPANIAMCEVPISDEDLQKMCYGIERRYPAGEITPVVTLCGKATEPEQPQEPVDWRTHYHTFEEVSNLQPVGPWASLSRTSCPKSLFAALALLWLSAKP
jgi:hypothetical protein